MDRRNRRERNRPNNTFRKNDNNEPVRGRRQAGTSNDTNNRKCEGTKPIGYKTLENLLSNEAEIILKLSLEKNGFLMLLDQTNIRPDMMCLIFSALARTSECSSEIETVQLLVHFYKRIISKLQSNANFFREIAVYSMNLQMHLAEHSQKRQQHIDAVENLLKFLRRLQSLLYMKSYDAIQCILHQFELQIEYINRKGNALNDRITTLIAELTESAQKFDEIKAKEEKQEVLLEPPNNFRDISIYPTIEDILYNHEPFIRKNVVDGKYKGGVEHYLDTQFRLLREDFVRPLRDGISEYVRLKDKADAMKTVKFRIKDLNVYRNVNIIGSRMVQGEQVHLCTFDCTPFKNLRWQFTKRMISGSLMCFSRDDFQTFFFATITGQRDPEKLAQGQFQIKLEIEEASMPEITPLITFVMVESQVYFKAYRHNLKVLQELGSDNFPLERYIVDVNKDVLPPSYLNHHTVYAISNGLKEENAKMLPVNILGNQRWPYHADLNLDESQFEAFRAALTKQVAVIQGPPGTGKTYIGLRIVETLLENTNQFPILIVCYTNHALDQFLEGILPFCRPKELIRIGGKSQSEIVQNFNLNNIKREMKNNRQVVHYIHQARFECSALMKEYQEQISMLEQQIENLKKQFFGCELKNIIVQCNANHLMQLQLNSRDGSLNIGILNWLGCRVESVDEENVDDDFQLDEQVQKFALKITAKPEIEEVIEEPMFDEEELIEIERERLIDYDSDDDYVSDDEYHRRQFTQRAREQMQINHGRTQNVSLDQSINLTNIVSVDADGFQTVANRNKVKNEFKHQIMTNETMSCEEAERVQNINSLSKEQRWNLYRLWIKMYVEKLEEEIKINRDLYRNECLRFNALRNQEDVEVVKSAKIIGMTTTRAAKFHHIINGVKPRITKAAEVLEAHIVTALCGKTEHLILIGDHLQLRPDPAVYDLAKKFNLEISLFERLIKNQMNFYQLKQQHRIRTCISSLLVPHIYKQLLDHPSVFLYEDVKGMEKSMFFINHQHKELSQQETRSHMNKHEASFIVQLCRHIILQGYDQSQVTILTTYSGQLHQIRQLMKGQHILKGVRATVVDNYQGEENDIILLSFVRSNEESNIGFLKTSNRVNVALSRAKKGLYCIGNFDCLAEKSQLWKDLMRTLKMQNAIGDALEIYCQNHTDYKTSLAKKDDFPSEGGCDQKCEERLPCGHACTSVCHIIDKEHKGIYSKCSEIFRKRMCSLDHRCKRKCHDGEECGQCKEIVKKVRPECGHTVLVKCSENPEYCSHKCERIRSCGHKCNGNCSQTCDSTLCNELVKAKAPCNHVVQIQCSNAKNKLMLSQACREPCNIELKCGHLCKGSCGLCKYGRLHISCREKCTRVLICGHPFTDTCSVSCPPCKKKCANRCVHSKCPLKCGQPCTPCVEPCQWKCDHLKCTKLCFEPCNRELCEHPDKSLLDCGHQSIGVCGEERPPFCRICNKDEVEEIFFGNEDEEDARFIKLTDCKHIIEVEGLLNWMKAEPDSNPNEASRVSIQLKKCPKCKTEIRHTKALNTFIQASLHDVQRVKMQTFGTENENRAFQRDLNQGTQSIMNEKSFENSIISLRPICMDILHQTKFDKNNPRFNPKPKYLLIEQDNKFKLDEQLNQICTDFMKRDKLRKNICDEAVEKFEERVRFATVFIKQFRNCDQTRYDIETELSFLQTMVEVIVKASNVPFNENGKASLKNAFELAHKYGSATESVQNRFKELAQEAFKHATGLGISLKEKQEILRAMDMAQGHWYKCPNGHIYAIGECGGAMEKSKCPECNAVIGGTSHSLVSDNALASEMDGATEPAWPTNLMAQLRPFMDD